MKHEENLTRYYFFFLVFIGSMIGLVVSDNFLQMFIFWEMVGMCSYSLISFWNNRPESVKSGNKVFLMTRIGDIMLLAAIGIIFATLGTFSFRDTITPDHGRTAGTLHIHSGYSGFLSFGRRHRKVRSAASAHLAVQRHGSTHLRQRPIARCNHGEGRYLPHRPIHPHCCAHVIVALQGLWLPVVAWIGVLTALVGATMALSTPDIKGVLAYSTVSQLGFMMAALGSSGMDAAFSGLVLQHVPHDEPRLLRRAWASSWQAASSTL